MAEEKARKEAADAERKILAEEKSRQEAAEAERKRLAEEKARQETENQLVEEEKQKNSTELPKGFLDRLQRDFEKSVNDPKVKKILVNGKEVTRKEALDINVFDVETSIVTYNTEKTESVLEIKLSKNK